MFFVRNFVLLVGNSSSNEPILGQGLLLNAKFVVAVLLKIQVVWAVTPCSW
jgi:hypothetical protein